jgi:Sec-independent protein secretion pathway component TatC
MLLPGTDPVTMLISMAPLVVLFELSLILARRFGRPPEASTRGSHPPVGEKVIRSASSP